MVMNDAVRQFIAFTCSSPEVAQHYLEMTRSDVQAAVELYLDMGGADASHAEASKKSEHHVQAGPAEGHQSGSPPAPCMASSGSEDEPHYEFEDDDDDDDDEDGDGAGDQDSDKDLDGNKSKLEADAQSGRNSVKPVNRNFWSTSSPSASLQTSLADPLTTQQRARRITRLVATLLSPSVQVQISQEIEDVPAKLSPKKIAKVFVNHVPGVQSFLYRQQPGVYALEFIQSAYQDGLAAFRGTMLHKHLTKLLRFIVHYGDANGAKASHDLHEIAEAFMDCQAVQARAIERVGLRLRGVTGGFRELVTALVGEYKALALKMLAAERIARQHLPEDANPAHYENRLTADLGEHLGLNMDEIRRAKLDEHAEQRFPRLCVAEKQCAAKRCRELFDMEALLKAFMSEVNRFGTESSEDSMAQTFLSWVSKSMTNKHIVLDAETCCRVEVGSELALATFEVLFLGQVHAPPTELYRGAPLCGLFQPSLASSAANSALESNVRKRQQSIVQRGNDHGLEALHTSDSCGHPQAKRPR